MLELSYRIFSNDVSGLITGLVLLGLGVLLIRNTSGLKRALAAVFTALSLILSLGGASHVLRVSAVDEALPAPGKLVDIGGYSVHVLAEGPSGSVPVVWFAGGHAGGLMVHHLHRLVREDMRSILVDRPGSGWSDTGPFPRTTRGEVDEVIRALEAAGEVGPFIFAGHSFGGLLAANIAYRYPEKTAAVALLDATPLDVIFYGADSEGLESFVAMSRLQGFLNAFGLYRQPIPETSYDEQGSVYVDTLQALPAIMALATRGGQAFATASAFEELTAEGLRDRAFDIAVYDGMLGDTPLYLVAPMEDPTTRPYVEMVLGPGADADRFYSMLRATRERYLSASSNSHRIIAPEGTGHNFPDSHPEFVADTVRQIQASLEEETSAEGGDASAASWSGPYGGVPPLDSVTPKDLDLASSEALEVYEERVSEIRASTESASFENTVFPLERAAESLRQLEATLVVLASTARTPEAAEVYGRQSAALSAARDAVAQDPLIFERIEKVADQSLSGDRKRLTEVFLDNMVRKGARLTADQQAQLRAINSELATLRGTFSGNTSREEQALAVFVADESRLSGLTTAQVAAAKAAAVARDRQAEWAIPMQRPYVWPVLRRVNDRALREEVWRSWVSRGRNGNEFDNRETIARILELRGEKARLFGFDNFAQWQTSQRMIGSPEAARELLESAWEAIEPTTTRQIKRLTELASDDLEGDGLKPWDFLYYHERQRSQDFSVDMDEVQSYFALENVIKAMFWSAGELYGLQFTELQDIPVVDESVRTFEVTRNEQTVGVLYADLFSREGKGPASWATQYRSFARMNDDEGQTQLPLVALHSAVTPSDEEKVYVTWERANVIFHEFGHTLQTLQNTASYPSIGPLTLPWDFIEAPSLLHERWFMDKRLLQKFMVNAQGEPIPEELIDRLNQSLKAERPITLTMNFLASAMVDMHLHTLADGRKMDVVAEEAEYIEGLGLPDAIDLAMYAPHAFHTFTEQYAAGLYTYLWSNAIAADAAAAFRETDEGLWNKDVAGQWRTLIEAANRQPISDSWDAFRGREPEVRFLFEAYELY